VGHKIEHYFAHQKHKRERKHKEEEEKKKEAEEKGIKGKKMERMHLIVY
jgi:hypothetical protein